MVWIPLVSALLGALIGSATTLIGQWLADSRRAAAELGSESRSTAVAAVERKRDHIVDLYKQVCEDMSAVDQEHNRSNELVNQKRAVALDELRLRLQTMETVAAASIALVDDNRIRDAVDDFYSKYVGYLMAETARMDGEPVEPEVTGDDVSKSREEAASAVREGLAKLREEEVQIFR